MNLLIGSLVIGLILSLLGLGVYISFRIFGFADITADGSFTIGAATAAILIVKGANPFAATLAGAALGCVAGFVTGVLNTKFHIDGLLAGILVMTGLYSVNLHIMGRSNVPLLSENTLVTIASKLFAPLLGGGKTVSLAGWQANAGDVSVLVAIFVFIILICFALYALFRTDLGTTMRATGDNPQMIRALGVNTDGMVILGLAVSNGLIALSGGLLAQYQGFADVQMGIGMVVWGLAAVIIGEALVRSKSLGYLIAGVVMGSVLFRLLVAIALRWGLNPNDLKLVTALFVLATLVVPRMPGVFRRMKLAGERNV
jgi:putative tryptophan/tyrosine transport system permease protein